ncbi:auxilin-like protein 1 isoform X2 [Durio zibethinus]|uniref:Auxilin-like protein 1 isoform X2 n=1 Tax=Durio zibethinus TaxID=66656 RepID=A0A6P6AW16_DURZI|nr:auxilin-like protein 1 isoform X2 [Durio zibethinus]
MEYKRASAATAFSKKVSNGHSFNGKNMYDGIFGGGQRKVGSRVEDYVEIFSGGSGSSIPVLDVPELNERKFSVDVSSSKLDYSNIFGGFGDLDFAVSHEEFIAKPTRDKKTPEGSFSYPSSIPMGSLSNDQTSHESGNGVKQFKMSYNKSSPGIKDGSNGTTHVAQLHAVPGYTCLIDESITPSRDKPVPSVVNEPYETSNFGGGIMEGMHCKKQASNVPPSDVNKQNPKGVDELHSESRSNGFDFNDVLFGSYDVGRRTPPPKMTRASSMMNNMGGNKHVSSKFGVSKSHSLDGNEGVWSPRYFDDEVDANSVAATSAAAVKKAIEEAQARLKVAKEMMERRKGHIGRVKPTSNGNSKAEERKKGIDAFKQDNAREICEKIDATMQTSVRVRKQNVMKVGQVAAESEDREKSFIAREAAGAICANNFISSQADFRQEEVEKREAAKQGEKEKDVMQALNEYEGEEKKIFEKPEKYGEKSEVVGDAPEQEYQRKLDASKELCHKEEYLHKLKPDVEFYDQKEDETKLRFSENWEETEEKVCNELEACERKLKDPEKLTEDERKVEIQEVKDIDNLEGLTVAQEWVDMEEKHKHMLKQEENGSALKDVFEKDENEMLTEDVSMQKEFEKISEDAFERSELKEEHKVACGSEKEYACDREDNEQLPDKIEKPEIIDLGHNGLDYEEGETRLEENGDSLGNEEFLEAEENEDLFEDAYQMEAEEDGQKEAPESVRTDMQKQTDQMAAEMTEAREDALDCCPEDLKAANDANNDNLINNLGETMEPSINEDSYEMTPQLLVNEENGGIAEGSKAYSECKETRRDSEAVEVTNDLEENLAFDKADLAESNLKCNEIEQQTENTREAFDFDRSNIDIDTSDITFEQNQYEQHSEESEIICTMEKLVEELACESEDVKETEFGLKQEENNHNSEISYEGRWVDAQLKCKFGEKHETTQTAHDIETSQSREYNGESHHESPKTEERQTKNASREEVNLAKEQQRRVDEAKEREREKEKERIAVERAIREARERAFVEARERAAAGRTNIEARRKVKAEAQGELAKPSAEANDKNFVEAKLKAERAAVERATAEARQRALEKALSEKASFGSRNQTEKFSDAKQSFQSYDSRYKGSCPPATSRYPNSSNQSGTWYTASNSSEGLDGATGESAQRRKARLERHQRTAERAAKALAEKNKRDLLAQKEQAERNRIAETLDAEVKRWSSGKQGNLRALLSTLQYILGPDSGWKPIPLTDIIATAAVKKAYRKATLCVHPDKLQQRGASIQQKYTCEKVFDLLKEAWNKFSAEEW